MSTIGIEPDTRSEPRPVVGTCRVCGHSGGKVLFIGTEERFGLGGAFPVVSCERCGFTWTDLPAGFDLDGWYERAYWQDFRARHDRDRRLRAPYRRLRDAWRAYNGSVRPSRWVRTGTTLDAGCGPGYDTAEMRQHGADVVGIDLSNRALLQAARLSLPVIQAVPTAFPFVDGSFDTVVMSHTKCL